MTRTKAKRLLDLEGKVELSFSLKEFLDRRRKAVILHLYSDFEAIASVGGVKREK